ncbi:MAG: arsenic efflux protein [Rhodobacteraceae bacterium]|nr:arsenic efflux protein [Paracoccaceae bacterium]MCY4196547.1 arsenic efflux protein [Paracoccaceae bacterium]
MFRTEFRTRRIVVAIGLIVAACVPGVFGDVTRGLLIDAYLQVSVFVAATFLIFYSAEKYLDFDIHNLLAQKNLVAVPVAAGLGATPGCGGAVMVVAAYSSGNVGFGAVVAALTATMGDAAFLLIAVRPDAAAVLLPTAFAVGIVSGWVINWWFPRLGAGRSCQPQMSCAAVGKTRVIDTAYLAAAIPGFAIGILLLFQVNVSDGLAWLPETLALTGVGLGLLIWSTSSFQTLSHPDDSPVTRTAEETSFVTVWVISAFLIYEYLAQFAGLDLEQLFQTVAPLLPLIAIIIGFIPGCGPQVLVTALYINGIIPFAALLGNAISNDGDALFPAIAVDPKAAIMATLASAVPALITAYGFYLLIPGFLN